MDVEQIPASSRYQVAAWFVHHYQNGRRLGGNDHLRACNLAVLENLEGGDGVSDGAEYVRLTATVVCPHGRRDDTCRYMGWSDFADMVENLKDPHIDDLYMGEFESVPPAPLEESRG